MSIDTFNNNIIGENLRSYRMKAGFSLREFGEKLDLSHMAIQKYEQGVVIPDTSTLLKVADVLNVPVDKLIQERPRVCLDQQAFRKKKIKQAIAKRLEDDISYSIANYLQVESYFDNKDVKKAKNEYKLFNPELYSSCEEISLQVRSLLGYGEHPIDNLVQSLEDRGFLVLELQNYNKVDGASGFYNGIPVIILSEIQAGDRMRFTTAHELGHLYIDISESLSAKETEDYIDCFASSFLMPRSIMESYFGYKRDKLSLKEVRDFKERFKVSMQAIIRRLCDLSIIQEGLKSYLLQQMYKNGMSSFEPGEVAPEYPKLMKRLVSQLVTEKIISVSKGAQLLNTNVKDFIENALLDY